MRIRDWSSYVCSSDLLLGAILAVLLTALIGARLFEPKTGVVAALLLASCLLLGVEARLAKTDAMLLACILAAQLALARAWTERDSAEKPALLPAMGFWLALGAGMLVKGPIILLACGGTALLLLGRASCRERGCRSGLNSGV